MVNFFDQRSDGHGLAQAVESARDRLLQGLDALGERDDIAGKAGLGRGRWSRLLRCCGGNRSATIHRFSEFWPPLFVGAIAIGETELSELLRPGLIEGADLGGELLAFGAGLDQPFLDGLCLGLQLPDPALEGGDLVGLTADLFVLGAQFLGGEMRRLG